MRLLGTMVRLLTHTSRRNFFSSCWHKFAEILYFQLFHYLDAALLVLQHSVPFTSCLYTYRGKYLKCSVCFHSFFLNLVLVWSPESAYSLHNRVFMGNLRTIILYAVFGTVFNFLLIGTDSKYIQFLNARLSVPLYRYIYISRSASQACLFLSRSRWVSSVSFFLLHPLPLPSPTLFW